MFPTESDLGPSGASDSTTTTATLDCTPCCAFIPNPPRFSMNDNNTSNIICNINSGRGTSSDRQRKSIVILPEDNNNNNSGKATASCAVMGICDECNVLSASISSSALSGDVGVSCDLHSSMTQSSSPRTQALRLGASLDVSHLAIDSPAHTLHHHNHHHHQHHNHSASTPHTAVTNYTDSDSDVCGASGSRRQSSTIAKVVDFSAVAEQGTRRTMEDRHRIITQDMNGHSFFAVYDGHGGTQCAEYLHENLHRLILDHDEMATNPEKAVREGIMEAEDLFIQLQEDSGCCCTVAVIVGDELVVGNVGDAEAILVGVDDKGKGHHRALSVVHQPQKNKEEGDRVVAGGGALANNRVLHPNTKVSTKTIAVSRAIGDRSFKLAEYTDGRPSGVIAEPHTVSVRLRGDSDEFIVIGCDGLWDVMSHEEVVEGIRSVNKNNNYSGKCDDLTEWIVDEAFARGANDNVTVMVIALPGSRRAEKH